MFKAICVILSLFAFSDAQDCSPSITTASGTSAPAEICSGSLIFEENFDKLDKSVWQPEITLAGGGVSINFLILLVVIFNSSLTQFSLLLDCF